MRIRRFLAFTLAFLLVFQSTGMPVFAGGDPTVSVSSVSGDISDVVDVTLSVSNNPGIQYMQIKVTYDSELVLVAVNDEGLLPGVVYQEELASAYYITWQSAGADVSSNGVLSTLSFRISENAKSNTSYQVRVTVGALDSAENDVPFKVTDGFVDVNCTHESKTEVPAKGATCTKDGNIRYFTCNDCGLLFTPAGKETTLADVTVAKLGHDYGEATCEEDGVCSRCGDFKTAKLGHDFTREVEDELHLKKAAEKCTEFNEYWYTCSRCNEISDTASFVSTTAAGPHDFSKKVEDNAHKVDGTGADCQHAVMYYYNCQNCSEIGTESFTSETKGPHTPGTDWITENGEHFHKCTIESCGEKMDVAACSGGTATCVDLAECSVCGKPYGALAAHSYSSTWEKDETSHWHKCSVCEEPDAVIAHTPNQKEPTASSPVKCTECGYIIADNSTKVVISTTTADMMSGESLQLEADFSPANPAGTIVWSLAEGDEVYATVNGLGRVTAKTVYEAHTITVYAAAKDNNAVKATKTITIHPYASAIMIKIDGLDYTGSVYDIDVNTVSKVIVGADVLPTGAIDKVEWVSSDTTGKYMTMTTDAAGNCVLTNFTLTSNNAVTVTLTAKATDGSKKTSNVKLHLIGKADHITIVGDTSTATNPTLMRGGATRKLVAELNIYKYVTDKSVIWELAAPKDTAYASISSAGVLTTVPVTDPVDIAVVARVANNPSVMTTAYIRLVPAAYKAIIDCATNPPVDGVISVDISAPPIQLDGSTLPATAIQDGTWKSSNNAIAVVSNDGKVTFNKPGTVTITFTVADGSKQTAQVKVSGGIPVKTLTLSGNNTIYSNGKTALTATMNGDATNKKLNWYSSNPSVATVSAKGVVTAKTVYQEEIITIYAAATDGSGIVASMKIAVEPKSGVLAIKHNGTVMNNRSIYVEVTEGSLNLDSSVPAIWKSSNTSVATVDENGGVSYVKTGTVTITAKSLDGKKSGKVTLKVANLVKEIIVTTKDDETAATIGSNKGKVALKARISPTNATVKSISWVSTNPAAATVSSSGVVSAKPGLHTAELVYIRAVPKDGSGNYGEFPVTVLPAVDTANILSVTNITTQDGIAIKADEVLNNRTLKFDVEDVKTLELTSKMLPTDAVQEVTWKSSNPKIASVDKDGKVTISGTGMVSITVTATDGSKKSATVKLNLVRYAKKIEFTNAKPLQVGSGSKLTLTWKLLTNSFLAPTSKTVAFSLLPNDAAFATISKTGVITAKSVTAPHKITVIAYAVDNPATFTLLTVEVLPKAASMDVLYEGKIVTGQTLQSSVGHTLKFDTLITPVDASHNVKWSVSSNVAEVREDGSIVGLKAGTVKITAKLLDGSNRTASVTVRFS